MATTTNYGWTTPDNTDLVKDGALAIRTLGSAIDTSMNTALGTKKAGMVLLNTTSFSGVASQSINDVFSATYQNYKILINVTSFTTAATTLNLRMRVSAADNTDAQNYAAGTNPNYITTTYSSFNSNAATTWRLATNPAGSTSSVDGFIDLYSPFTSLITKIDSMFITTSDGIVYRIGGIHNVASSFTGFTIYPTGGNMTGSVSVYGYNK